MTFSLATSISQVSNHPLIVEQLENISSVKIGNTALGRKRLAELARSWQPIKGLNDVTCGRIKFVASQILSSLNEGSTDSEQVLSVLCACTNLKNALQVEAVLFGNLAPIIEKFIEMSKVPYLAELIERLPEIVSKIKYSPMDTLGDTMGFYIIDANLFLSYIESIGIEKMPNEFDIMFFTLLQRYEWRDGNIIIPFSNLPSKDLLEKIISEKGLYAKLIAQVLYLCIIDEEILFKAYTTRAVAVEVMKILGKDMFDVYYQKQPLMPFFCLALDGIKKAKSSGIALENFYLQRSFLDSFSHIMTKDWLKESAGVYQVVKKIEISSRKLLDRSMLARFDSISPNETCDSHVLIYSQMMHDMKHTHHFVQSYPITREKPFCHSAEEFENVVLANFINKLTFESQDKASSFSLRLPKDSKSLKSSKKAVKKISSIVEAAISQELSPPCEEVEQKERIVLTSLQACSPRAAAIADAPVSLEEAFLTHLTQ
jgi:hypothetical protein